MPGIESLLQAGGPVALLGALCVALKYGVDALNAWRKGRPTKVPLMSDAETTNALLLKSLQSEREDNAKKNQRIGELEQALDAVRKMLYDQSDNYERELLELRRQLEYVTVRLENMQERLRSNEKES